MHVILVTITLSSVCFFVSVKCKLLNIKESMLIGKQSGNSKLLDLVK